MRGSVSSSIAALVGCRHLQRVVALAFAHRVLELHQQTWLLFLCNQGQVGDVSHRSLRVWMQHFSMLTLGARKYVLGDYFINANTQYIKSKKLYKVAKS